MPADDRLFDLITPSDLAPGERRARLYDPRALDVRFVRSADDPLFAVAYEHLWREFGSVNEMELREVLERRLAWDPATLTGDAHLLYEMILARDQAGAFVAARDHTAILPRGVRGAGGALPPLVVVHLSHLLIAPAHRGTGLAGWMRAWPLATAGACVAAAGVAGDVQTVLVAEMEHPGAGAFPAGDAKRATRLVAYEKAGFKKVDPAAVDYWQPDFRRAADIDADQVRPLPLGLVVRRVGRETEPTITGAEVRRITHALYGMYATDFRVQDMAVVYDHLSTFPADDVNVPLLAPTE